MPARLRPTNAPLFCGLFLLLSSSALTLPSASVAGDSTINKERIDETVRNSEEETVFLHETLPLDAVLTYAQGHNPTIRAARARLTAAQERPAQVSALDDPMFTYEGFNIPENLNFTRADNNILKLSQKLPFPGKRRLRGEIATHEVAIVSEEVRRAEIMTRADVKKAYYDLWQVHQNLLVYSREKELAAQFAAIAEKKYAVGQVSQPDVLRAQVELTRLINRVTTQTLKLGEVRAMLNGLLSRPPEAPLGMPQDAPQPVVKQTLAELTELTLKNRPEITANAAAIARDTATLALSRKAYFPDFEVYVERFFNGGRKDGVGVILSATIPLAYRQKYDAGVAEASARLSASQADLHAAQDTSLAEVKGALVRAQIAVELVNLFTQTHIPQAEQTLDSSRISYQTSKVDFLSLIDSLRVVEQVHLEHIAAAADFEKAYADLERAVGQALPGT
ncbi:MAG: TolC family protein [Deltaproteobacteria bacterium]|nr:TolC family protein [Deltaproteobacteria bacterium]